jgi:hypothetical protein
MNALHQLAYDAHQYGEPGIVRGSLITCVAVVVLIACLVVVPA